MILSRYIFDFTHGGCEKIFYTLSSIQTSTTIILWDIKRADWLLSMHLKYPINAYINILHGTTEHNRPLYILIDLISYERCHKKKAVALMHASTKS